MEPIAHLAKAALKTSPDYPALTVASSRLRKGTFVGAAQSLAEMAAKYEAVFTADGMPADFLTSRHEAITTMTASQLSFVLAGVVKLAGSYLPPLFAYVLHASQQKAIA
jgi:hypothetical protein